MEKQFEQILKEQVILDFHQRGLDNLIVFFIAKYPNFPYTELEPEKILPEYLEIYDISFLASYIRYSDRTLLGSGMRDEVVRKKLCFLHLHVGTILPFYRKFIWDDSIALEDLKRWLPLLSNFIFKNKFMRCTKITPYYKQFIDACLDTTSFPYRNLELLSTLYSENVFEIDDLSIVLNQETFYKLLKIVKDCNIDISYEQLLSRFLKLQGLLEQIPLELITQYYFVIEEYLREPSDYLPTIHNIEDFEIFRKSKEKAHREFLEHEFDLYALKDFYCRLFLGISETTFKQIFLLLPKDSSEPYLLLKELFEAKFPLALKENLYEKFMNYGNLRPYIEGALSYIGEREHLYLKQEVLPDAQTRSLITMQNSKFCFITSSMEDYQNAKETVSTTIQSDTYFPYQAGCLVSYSNPTIISQSENTCIVQKKGLHPKFLLAFDIVTFEHLVYQKKLHVPIVMIETESYVKKLVWQLEILFEAQDWESYRNQKRNLFLSIKDHPWLFAKYFTLDTLYEDVRVLQEKIEKWIAEKNSVSFLRTQIEVLEKLISLNEELEVMFTNEKKASFQYRKKMIQYDKG